MHHHDLRHTCATLRLTKGVHSKIVSEMLGHFSRRYSLNIYRATRFSILRRVECDGRHVEQEPTNTLMGLCSAVSVFYNYIPNQLATTLAPPTSGPISWASFFTFCHKVDSSFTTTSACLNVSPAFLRFSTTISDFTSASETASSAFPNAVCTLRTLSR